MATNRFRIGWLIAILSLSVAYSTGSPVHAQGTAPGAILVAADTGDDSAPRRYLIYGPDGGQPLADLGTTAPALPAVSPAPRWALNDQGQNQSITVEDTQSHQTVYTLPDSAVGADLSPSTRYLTYSDVHTVSGNITWLLHIVDLSDLSDRQFGDTLVITPSQPFGQNKGWAKAIPGLLGAEVWNRTESTLVLFDYLPESEVEPNDHFLLQLGKLPHSSKSIPPTLTTLPGSDQFALSPDGNQAAYLSETAAHDPPNYQRFGPSSYTGRPYDTLRLVDLSTAKLKVVAKAAPGAGIDQIQWSADGKRLYYFAGNFADTDYITNPLLDYVDLAANKTVKVSPLYTDSTDQLDQYQICTGQLYYIAVPMHAIHNEGTLWVASMENVSQRVSLELPDTSLWYSLLSCVDPPK